MQKQKRVVRRCSEILNLCTIRNAATLSSMTYHCQIAAESTHPRFTRLRTLHKDSCGLASIGAVTTPVMDVIADAGIRESDLGTGFTQNQALVAPFFQAYHDVRQGIIDRLNGQGPVATLKS